MQLVLIRQVDDGDASFEVKNQWDWEPSTIQMMLWKN